MLRSDIRRAQTRASAPDRLYGPASRGEMQALLSTLAQIDHAFEVDLETVRTSDALVTVKQGVMDTLRQRHQERRVLILRELAALQRR